MGLPSKKRTNRSKRDRASHFALKPIAISFDEDGNAHLPHRATPKTGKYRGQVVTKVEKRTKRSAKKAR